MKMPDKVRIGGVEYCVVEEDRLNNGEVMLAGEIRHTACEIAIASGYAHEYQCLTLWHEILHGIEMQMQLDLGDKREQIIEAFSHGVYQVLQDNESRFFRIAPNEKRRDKDENQT